MRKSASLLFVLTLLVFGLYGCLPVAAPVPSQAVSATVVPPTAAPPTAAPPTAAPPTAIPPTATLAAPTVAAPTASPVAWKGVTVSANGVELVVPDVLGSGADAKVVPEVAHTVGSPGWGVSPVHYKFALQGYPVAASQSVFEPVLLVYPASEYALVREAAAFSLDRLRAVLAAPSASITKDTLPAIPYFNSALMMASSPKIVAFQGGAGVRALVHYAQGLTPVTNDYLFYQYQGLSADGKYYLIAILPVTAPFLQQNFQAPLPADGMALPQDVAGYEVYLAAIADRLAAAEKDGLLTPAPSALDALIESVKLNNPVIVPPSTPAVCQEQATFRNEETPKDNATFAPNAPIVKQWTIYNTGTCIWTPGYTWVFVSGDQMGGSDLSLEKAIAVSNGGVTVFADLTAPAVPGTYTGHWGLRNAAGEVVPIVGGTKDNTLFVKLVVK